MGSCLKGTLIYAAAIRGDDKKEKVVKVEKTFFQEVRDIVGTGLEFVNYKNYKPYPKKGVKGLKDTKETLK